MTTNDIKRVIDKGLANVTTTPQDVDAIMELVRSGSRPRRAPMRKARIAVAVLVMVLVSLLLSVIALGLSVPVWDVFVETTDQRLEINVGYTDEYAVLAHAEKTSLYPEEVMAWGEDICTIFDEVGIYPALPTYMPEGFKKTDLDHYLDGYGYAYVNAKYGDGNCRSITLTAHLYNEEGYTFTAVIEQDGVYYDEFEQDGVTYRIVSNGSNYNASWYDQNGSYNLFGNVEPDVLRDMVASIRRESDGHRERTMVNAFSAAEIAAWGEEICVPFNELGIYPDLPEYIPEGFVLDDPVWNVQKDKYSFIDFLYKNEEGKTLNIVIDIFDSGDFVASISVEFDYREFKEINLQGVTYYIGSNLSRNSAAWYDSEGFYVLSGDISMNELEKMVRSIDRDPNKAIARSNIEVLIDPEAVRSERNTLSDDGESEEIPEHGALK